MNQSEFSEEKLEHAPRQGTLRLLARRSRMRGACPGHSLQ